MGSGRGHRARGKSLRVVRALVFLVGALALLGIASTVPSGSATATSGSDVPSTLHWAENGSGGSDPPESSTSGGLCPSGGPVILGVNWNCVAVLNMTELALILVSIGIIAYVFKDADRAELPGDSSEVPITAEELEAYRRARELDDPYDPADSQYRGENR
ncbi:MAG: hypothetical protein WB786_08065 [Thermoplasmata archaeon]